MQTTAQGSSTAAAIPPEEPTADDKFHATDVITISAGHGLHDTYTAFLAPVLPRIIEALALSNAQAGALTAFQQLPSLFQPVVGYLSDRMNMSWFFIFAPAITATAMCLIGSVPYYWMLALLMLITGASSSSLHAVGPAVLGHRAGKELGRGMSYWMAGGEVGRTIGPMIIVYGGISLLGYENIAWLMIGGWITSFVLFYRLKSVPKPVITRGQRSSADPWQQVVWGMRGLFIPLTILMLARLFLNVCLSTFLPTYLVGAGETEKMAAIALTLFQAAGVFGALLSGPLSDRIGRRPVMLASVGLSPFLVMLFVASSGLMQYAVLIVLGFVALSLTPPVMALVQESFPENRALANGLYMMINFIMLAGVSLSVGWMADQWNFSTAYLISAVIGLAGLPVVFFLPNATRKANPAG